jgi:hypothetical protein
MIRNAPILLLLTQAAATLMSVQAVPVDWRLAMKTSSSPTHLKSMVKAVSWRGVGAVDTFALAFFITGHAGA